ncbi:MAG: tripartite tricarboxylate transporter TctB family protein [Trueperaceae bacterium]
MRGIAEFVRRKPLGFSLLAICALFWFVLIPQFVPGQDPSMFPRAIIGWIAFFAALTIVLPPVTTPLPVDEDTGTVAEAADSQVNQRRVLGMMFIWALYVLATYWWGFYISTYLMLAISMYYLGARSPLSLFLRPALVLVIIYLVLQVGLRFRLPEAFWQ